MARTTIDDCLTHCPNHFELVLGVADRARRLAGGEQSTLSDPAPDRLIVQALREVASGSMPIAIEQGSDVEPAADGDFLDEGKEGKDYQYPDDESSEAKT
ncbi:MAG: DNA-directed RNA polymerase subunit omega [Betaproteobacteria bacterium]|nr:DNA-directed RNA polymerase subunit omega [Betaproteobacteria bacterium]